MVVNNPRIRPYFLGGVALGPGGLPIDFHDFYGLSWFTGRSMEVEKEQHFCYFPIAILQQITIIS